MKIESNWTKTRYTFICEDEKDKKFLGEMNRYIDGLEEENKKLKEEKDLYKARNEELNENCFGLSKENKKLKAELEKLKSTYVYDAKQVRDIC